MAPSLGWRHHTLIQMLLSRGPLKEDDFRSIFSKITGKSSGSQRQQEQEKQKSFNEYLRKINAELSYVQLELRACRNQYDGNVYYGVVNNVSDDQSKLGTKYTVPQIAFYKGIVEAIVQDPEAGGCIFNTDALNVRLEAQYLHAATAAGEMDVNSWFRRSVSKLKKTSFTTSTAAAAANTNNSKNKLHTEEEEHKLYGITHQLIEFIKSFSLDTFKNFPLPEESECDGGNSGSVRTDLSEWQETHAMLVLSRVKELAQLRFQLCPRYLKERQFWRIYFTLVKNYVAEYELHAVSLAKVKQITTASETVSESSFEVEMSEAKFISSATSLEQNSSDS